MTKHTGFCSSAQVGLPGWFFAYFCLKTSEKKMYNWELSVTCWWDSRTTAKSPEEFMKQRCHSREQLTFDR